MLVNEQEYERPTEMLRALAKQQRRMQQLYAKGIVLSLFDLQRADMEGPPATGSQITGYRYYLEDDNKRRFSPVMRDSTVPLPEEESRGYFFFSRDMSSAYMFSRIYGNAYNEAFYDIHTSVFNDSRHYAQYKIHGELEEPMPGWNTAKGSFGAGFVAHDVAPISTSEPTSYIDKEDYDKIVEIMRILGTDKVREDGIIKV